jgi:5-methylcytosine-specific restriction endonuclease McrA
MKMKKRKANKGKNQISARYVTRLKQYGDTLAIRDGGWYCHYCSCAIHRCPDMTDTPIKPRQATIDHKTPLSKGGADMKYNMVLACFYCNQEKGDGDYTQFYEATAHRRHTPRPQLQRTYPGAEEPEDVYDNEGR